MASADGLETVRELLRTLADQARYLNSTGQRLQRQLAAAGLVRCRALLHGMLLLDDAGRHDVVGVCREVHCEFWLAAMYLLRAPDGPDTIAAFGVKDAKDVRRILLDQGRDDQENALLKRWREVFPQSGGKPDWARLAKQLDQLLGNNSASDAYTNIYRQESLRSVHAGLVSLCEYLSPDLSSNMLAVLDKSDKLSPWSIVESGILTAKLALDVYEAFGVVQVERSRVRHLQRGLIESYETFRDRERLAGSDQEPVAS